MNIDPATERINGPLPNGLEMVSRGRTHATLRRAGMVLGIVLLMAAIWMVWRQRDVVSSAVQSIQNTSRVHLMVCLGVLLGSVAANVVLSGALFSMLVSRYGRVGLVEMQALIASATLMNYLPLRPGFFGRLAYHKSYNNISFRDSTMTVLQAMGLSGASVGIAALIVLIQPQSSISTGMLAATILLGLLIAAAVMGRQRLWMLAAAVRFVEVLVIAARYMAAFALIGSPIDSRAALAFACISVVATLVPFLSNGLGLREWMVGLMAPILSTHHMELGITADLLNRGAELVMATACGLLGMAWLVRARRGCTAVVAYQSD